MRNILFAFLIACIAIPTIFSCATPRYMYSPGASNVPLLNEKGDNKIAINYSTNFGGSKSERKLENEPSDHFRKKSRGTDIMAAYAITNNFAVQSSFFSRVAQNGGSTTGYFDSSTVHYKRTIFDVGLGYYTKMDTDGSFWFQVFAGAGKGKFSFKDAGLLSGNIPYTRFHKADVTKYYVQPAFIYQEDYFGISLASRINFIRFSNIETNYTKDEENVLQLTDARTRTLVFWEPTFINNFGVKGLPGLRLEYQLGMSFHLSNDIMHTRIFNFSIGLMADLSKLIKRK